MTNPNTLKQCPFCGAVDHLKGGSDLKGWGFWVVCESCGAGGPVEDTQIEALQRWNTRVECKDAPKALQKLSTNGGDEDWLAEIPPYLIGLDNYGLPLLASGLYNTGHWDPEEVPHPFQKHSAPTPPSLGEYIYVHIFSMKQCPFCGAVDHLKGGSDLKGWGFWVVCESCGAGGPVEDTQIEALQRWNTRAECK